VWIDCEMTGLDVGSDKLIEIAVLVTDADLNILGDGVDVVIHADDAALSSMVDVVTQMHTRSGLIEEVRASTVDLATAEKAVLDYIRQHVKQGKTAPLAGNSIATDRGFIARDMPALDSFLHYRMIDVSSIKELCRRWYPRIYYGQPAKGLAHRALADIHESIRELQYYRRTAFDIGEWGLGFMTTSLSLGCDCLGEITYLDAVVHDSHGSPVTIPNAICIHEEDSGVLWKHVDERAGAEVRRARRLVVSFHVTVANYEYLVYWRFYQDGSIECEVRATGIMVTSHIAAPGSRPAPWIPRRNPPRRPRSSPKSTARS